jgi:hypothetical protein
MVVIGTMNGYEAEEDVRLTLEILTGEPVGMGVTLRSAQGAAHRAQRTGRSAQGAAHRLAQQADVG